MTGRPLVTTKVRFCVCTGTVCPGTRKSINKNTVF